MAGSGPGSKEIAWEHYFRLLLRQRWMVIVPAVFGALVMAIYSLTLKDLYQGRSTILVEPQSIPTDFMRSTLPYGPETYVRSLVEQIKSLSRLEKIIKEFDLYPRMRSDRSIEEVVGFMRERIEIVRRENETFSVAFIDESPVKVEQVTNRLTDMFIEENLKFRLDRSTQNVEFLESQSKRLRDEVGEQETRIQQFKTKHLDRLPEQRLTLQIQLSAAQQQLQTTGESLVSARAKALSAHDREAILNRASGPYVMGGVRQSDPLEAQIAKTRQELSQLKTMYSERHPDVQAKQRELGSLERQLTERGPLKVSPRIVRRAPVSIDAMHATEEGRMAEADIVRLEADELRLREQIRNLNERIEDSPRVELQLSELAKGLTVMREQADSFQKKATDASASLEMERRNQGSQFRALDRARVPSRPISPNRPFLVLLGAGAGLALGLLMIVGLDIVFRPFLDEQDLAQFANVPVLVSIPHLGPFPSEWERLRGQISNLLEMLLGALPFAEREYRSQSPLNFSGSPMPSALADREPETPGQPAKGFTYLLGDPIAPTGPPRDRVPSWKGEDREAVMFPIPGVVAGHTGAMSGRTEARAGRRPEAPEGLRVAEPIAANTNTQALAQTRSPESVRPARVATAAFGSRTSRPSPRVERQLTASVTTAAAHRMSRENGSAQAAVDLDLAALDLPDFTQPEPEEAPIVQVPGNEDPDGTMSTPTGAYREVSRFRALLPDKNRHTTADIAAALRKTAEDATRSNPDRSRVERAGRISILGTHWANPARYTIQTRLDLGSGTSSDETLKELGRRPPWGNRAT